MVVSVRLFAVLRERAGRDAIDLELQEGATVADALTALARRPELTEVLSRLAVVLAVNREYADESRELREDDELALIPPVSGGTDADIHVRVSDEPLDAARLTAMVGRPQAGAIVAFHGTTREVDRLDYEAYREMAEERMAEILQRCVTEHGLAAAAAEHRIGSVPLGEASVVVAVSAAHREEAFAGARAAIDAIKAEAPIWKREVEVADDGERGRWVAGTAPASGDLQAAPVSADKSRVDGEGVQAQLSHLDSSGRARMVDVGAKPATERRALARATVRMSPDTARAVARGDAPKGDVLGTARLAGIQAAKRTAELVPLAHPLPLSFVDVRAGVDAGAGVVELEAEARTVASTGVEMEAMSACAVAALTIYDMVKGLERGVTIERVELLRKSGGRHDWQREEVA